MYSENPSYGKFHLQAIYRGLDSNSDSQNIASTISQMLCNLALGQVPPPRSPSSSKSSGFPLLIMTLRNLPKRTTGIYSIKSTKHISLLFSRQLLKYLEHIMSKTVICLYTSPKRKMFCFFLLVPSLHITETSTASSCTLSEQVQWSIYF
jgi:hypothetical protein